MLLSEILKNIKDYKVKVYNFNNLQIKGISCDSRKIKEGFIFVALKGYHDDGFRFIPEAIKKGAKVIFTQSLPKDRFSEITYIQVKNSRKIYARLCADFYGNPSQFMKVIGVTGTNGKTTVTYLVEKILKQDNKDCLLIGTINYRYKNKVINSHNTTPSNEEIQFLLSEAKREGIGYAVIEVSSHGLSQGRVDNINFYSAIFTNLSQDHLDYHCSIQRYFEAKAKLFKILPKEATAIINRDDPYGRKLLKLCKANILTYGLNKRADIYASDIKMDIKGLRFFMHTPKGKIRLKTSLVGEYNIYNILAASTFAVYENIGLDTIRKAVEDFIAPLGRLQEVYRGDFSVYIDYAHTPFALKNVLLALRKIFKKRIILVFGCGGERDVGKRPKMGKIATELADYVVITSDNPRREDPLKIIRDIVKGINKKNYKVIPERKEAIFFALSEAKAGDVVLVAGKGHEQYQIVNDKILPFDDQQVVKEYFNI